MTELAGWIAGFAGLRVLVLGDIILDEYLTGTATRMSREAPIPVLELEQRQLIPGGAANPAANIAALGGMAQQAGVVGSDSSAVNLKQVLQAKGIDITGIVTDAARPTTVKTRIMAAMGLRFPQQVARLDTLSREPINDMVERRLREVILAALPGVRAVLISDYHIGLLTPALIDSVRKLAQQRNVLVTVDAQGALDKYAGMPVVKCNANDAMHYLKQPLRTDDDYARAAQQLVKALRLRTAMVITRGGDGATYASRDGHCGHLPAPAVTDVFDTVGAGDTFIAVLTLALAAGAPLPDAVALANAASGIVVRRVGNYTPSPDEVAHALRGVS
jgi:rfaE bifunctional protein kinase chain/domain